MDGYLGDMLGDKIADIVAVALYVFQQLVQPGRALSIGGRDDRLDKAVGGGDVGRSAFLGELFPKLLILDDNIGIEYGGQIECL